jgi:hypothetical protein
VETLRFFTHGPFCATDGERAWRTRFVRCDLENVPDAIRY